MAINISIYSNANGTSKTVTMDFVGDVLAADHDISANVSSIEYYFKITTGARQDNNATYPVKIVRSFSDLVLNRAKQRKANVATDYANVSAMVSDYIYDYIYDYINGHDSDLYSSGCTEQRPMKFSV